MKLNLTVIVFTFIVAVVISSCDDPEFAFNEDTLDIPYLFSEGYQDEIKYPYELATPPSDWLSMVKDETKVCKLSIPGTHDSMTGMGFYQPVIKNISNITAISQLCTFDEQMNSGIRFFDLRPVVSIDTLATDPAERQILRLAHGFTEINVTFEEGTPKFILNNGKEIKASGKEAGITQVFSWLKAWPNLQVKIAYKIF